MADPPGVRQVITSAYDSAGARAYLADLKRIRSEQEKTRKAIGSNLTEVANATRRNSENIERLIEKWDQRQQERQERRESQRILTMVGAVFAFFLVMVYVGFKVLVKISEASSDNRV
jgi:type VI protein secretion system component VasF